MKVLALDIATRTGVCLGIAGEKPSLVQAIHLRPKADDPVETAWFNLATYLRDLWIVEKPDLVVCEAPVPPAGQKSQDAALVALGCYTTVSVMTGLYSIMLRAPHSQTISKHFTGKARWSQAEGGRPAKKAATIARCHLLGYLAPTERDADKADACMIFDFASYNYARRQPPRELHLFGEQAPRAEDVFRERA